MGESPKIQILLLPPEEKLLKKLSPITCSLLPHPNLPLESLDDMKDDIPSTRNDTIRLMSLNKIKTYVVDMHQNDLRSGGKRTELL